MDKPNVLLVVLDAVRKDHLSCYGHSRKTTPHLDALADDGTKYESAFAAAPWTPPSHASMFTGKYPSYHGVFGTQPELDKNQPVLAEELSNLGYKTVGFSNSYHTSKKRGYDRGFDFYHDILDLPRFRGKMFEPSIDYARFVWNYFFNDYDVSDFQLRKLKSAVGKYEEPFFGFINLNSAHSPYDPPEPFKSQLEEDFESWDEVDIDTAKDLADDGGYRFMMNELDATEEEWELVKRWYDGEISYIDNLLGELLEYLKKENLYEDTLIFVTSDHGEHFGEHGLAYHQFSLRNELLEVPLILKGTSTENPSNTSGLVSLVDLAPTILDAAGAEPIDSMQGRSLFSKPVPEAVYAEYGKPYPPLRDRLSKYGKFDQYDRGLQAVITDEYKLIQSTEGDGYLYEIEGEKRIQSVKIKKELVHKLCSKLRELPEGDKNEQLDEHVEDHLKRLGYM